MRKLSKELMYMLMPLSATKPRAKCAICKYWNGEKPEPPVYGYYIIEKENKGSCYCENSDFCNQCCYATNSCASFELDECYTAGNLYGNSCNLTHIHIPACVDKLNELPQYVPPFYYCENLESITVDENNKNFCSVDGVLFSKDRKTLVKYPPAKADKQYIIPETTEKISQFAFMNYCFNLEWLRLPEFIELNSLKRGGQKILITTNIKISGTLDFGKNAIEDFLDYFGGFALSIHSSAFAADEDNESIVCKNGVLFSKDMKKLIAYPTYKKDAVYYIPQDVESTNRSFWGNEFISEIYVPLSVKEIPYYEFSSCENLKKIHFDENHFLNKISSISFVDTLKSDTINQICHILEERDTLSQLIIQRK